MEEVDAQYLLRLYRDGHVPYSNITSCLGQGSTEEHYSQQGLPTREDDIVLSGGSRNLRKGGANSPSPLLPTPSLPLLSLPFPSLFPSPPLPLEVGPV